MPVLDVLEWQERQRSRPWSWPVGINSIPDLLRAARSGFSLIYFFGSNDQQVYRFLRDGDVSTGQVFSQTLVRQAHALRHYFGHHMKMNIDPADLRWPTHSRIPREVFLLKLTTKASRDYA